MSLTKQVITSLMLGATMFGATFTASTAFADAPEGSAASCMGFEASDDSPPGSLSGATNQFGMPGVMNIAIQGAVEAGLFDSRGEFIRLIADGHLGSHEACDEALGLDPDTE